MVESKETKFWERVNHYVHRLYDEVESYSPQTAGDPPPAHVVSDLVHRDELQVLGVGEPSEGNGEDREEKDWFYEDELENSHPLDGKGLFVRRLSHASKEGTAAGLADLAFRLDLDSVFLQVGWHENGRENGHAAFQHDLEVVHALRENTGCKVVAWFYPWRGLEVQVLDNLRRWLDVVKFDVDAVLVNAEKGYYASSSSQVGKVNDQAASLVHELRQLVDAPLGLSSYPIAAWHPRFAWEGFSTLDFGCPQVYDTNQTLGPNFPRQAVESYSALFGGRHKVFPTFGASSAHTAQQMRDRLSRTPICPGVSWWDAHHLRYSNSRQEVVRSYAWPEVREEKQQ